jgi:hypothetical protein
VRRLCDFYHEHHERFDPGTHVAATIVNVCEFESAAQMLRDSIDARILDSVADGIDRIGEVVWIGGEPEVYYANHFPKAAQPVVDVEPEVTPPAPEPKPTAPPHIRVDMVKCRVWIGNDSYEVTPDAAELIQALVDADGVPINASDVVARTTRVLGRLPKEVRELIETSAGKGTCIPRDRLHP